MTNHRSSGASIPLAVVCAFFMIVLATAVFFLVQILGGGSEVRNAADSGTLNVVKQAIVFPSVPLPSSQAIGRAFQGLIDPQTGGVDLLTYNRFVGQALLVALNAAADGNPDGIANAQAAINLVEGLNGSIGQNLQKQLSDPNSNNSWVPACFNQSAARNPLSMAETGQSIVWNAGNYAYSYMGSGPTDDGSTNIQLDKQGLPNQMPFSNYQMNQQLSLPARAVDGTGNFLRGYAEIKVDGVGSIFAVPLSSEQPHLVNLSKFNSQKNDPAAGRAIVPANSFFNTATVTDQKSNTPLTVSSAGTVGAAAFPQSPYPLAIPNGYLIIDNSGQASYSGPVPNPDNVAANELGVGIQVDPASGCFSDNGAVEAWEQYNAQAASGNGANNGGPPGLDGLYSSGGAQATISDAMQIGSGPPITCTDFNSDPSNPDACPTCTQHMTPAPGGELGPFDLAYHPNGGYAMPGGSADSLTSGEMAKMDIFALYSQYHGWGFYLPATFVIPPVMTGMRLYPQNNNPIAGVPTPWGPFQAGFNQHFDPVVAAYSDRSVVGKVTTNGTIVQLMQQTTSVVPYSASVNGSSSLVNQLPPSGQAPADELTRFITNRIYQIKPNASQAEINNVLNTPIALGQVYYVYQNNNNAIVMSTTAPLSLQSMGSPGRAPDGTPHVFSKTFNILGILANPPFDDNIHIAPFMLVLDPGTAIDTLTVTYTPASGAYNLLGVVKFQELASNGGASPPVLSEPD